MVPRDPDSINPSRKIAILEKFISESEDLDDEINGYRNATNIDDTNQDLMDQDQTETDFAGEEGQTESGQINLAGEEDTSIDGGVQ